MSHDSDSDLDLDLNELDPQTTSRPRDASPRSPDLARHIPLRNLRFGGRRRQQRSSTTADEGDAIDLDPLVGSSDDERSASKRKTSFGDDAPLLSNGHTRQSPTASKYHKLPLQRRRRRGFWDYVPSFLPSSNTTLGPTSDDDTSGSNRTVEICSPSPHAVRYPANAISNAKYTPVSFLPRTLFNEFKFFFNLYFLLVALSQIIPALRIGYLSTYIAPLAFVVSVTLGKEAYDDIYRRKRDREANSEVYTVLRFDGVADGGATLGTARSKKGKDKAVDAAHLMSSKVLNPTSSVTEVNKPSKDLKVGDVVVLGKDMRVPADVVILKSFSNDAALSSLQAQQEDATLVEMGENVIPADANLQRQALAGQQLDNDTTTSDPSGGGEAFIRTDQLDGETDWKLRLAPPLAQTLRTSEYVRLSVAAGPPSKRVNDFAGTLTLLPAPIKRTYDPPVVPTDDAQGPTQSASLTIDNTAWANTVLASSTTIHALILYTGPQTRAALSTSPSRSKTGLLEYEINSLTKILCILTALLSFILVALEGFDGAGWADPQNPDASTHTWYIATLRFLILFSTIVPISLRVNLDMGKSVYAWFIHRDLGIPGTVVRTSTIPEDLGRIEYLLTDKTGTLTRNEMVLRKVHVGTVSYGGEAMVEVKGYVRQAFDELDGLWTPARATGGGAGATRTRREIGARVRDLVLALAICHNVTPTAEEDTSGGETTTAYQASSPDEIAIVRWTEQVGLKLLHRDRQSISLQFTGDGQLVVKVEVLHVFPFTSDSKRMGIIVRFLRTIDGQQQGDEGGEIVFFQKGADTVMSAIVAANDWLDEETANMAREGLRTLVIARKNLTSAQYAAFSTAYGTAALSIAERDVAMTRVVKSHLENNLDLLGVTGVEDKLQAHVKPSLELLRNAGIKIWMLTGDKVETARCIAISSKLVSRGQYIHTIAQLTRKETALDALSLLHSQPTSALLIDGQSLALYLHHHADAFIALAVRLPAVIACRCSPTQKADIAHLIRAHTHKRIACIGDGGNDVSMIQAADVGVGIVGKEGKQASLAADFSITQFSHLTKLLVWHGRNSYKRSAKLAQFVIHRGLIISVCQACFSIASHFEPIALYRDWLLVGYATVYTMMPVFSLTLDRDVDEGLANLYPELYKELTLGRSLSYRSFFVWVGISVYQGLIIQGGAELLIPSYASDLSDGTNPSDLSSTVPEHFPRMLALSYTALIINELLMVAFEITTWHPIMLLSLLGTGMLYFGTVPFLGGYFDLAFCLTIGFWWRVAAVCAVSLGPVWVGRVVRRKVKPAGWRKVRGF